MRRLGGTIVLAFLWVLTLGAQQGDDTTARLKELGADAAAVGAVVATLKELLEKGPNEARLGALDWLLKDPKAHDPALAPLILNLVVDPDREVRSRAIRNLRWLFEEAGSHQALEKLVRAATAPDKGDRLEALSVIRQSAQSRSPLSRQPAVRQVLLSLLQHQDPETLVESIKAVRDFDGLLDEPQFLAVVGGLAASDDGRVRSAAAEVLLARIEALEKEKEKLIKALEKGAEKDPAVRSRIAAFRPEKSVGQAAATPLLLAIPPDAPDLTFFAAFVQPLLAEPIREAGGKSCVDCHSGSDGGNYGLEPATPDGKFHLQATLFNYQSTLGYTGKGTGRGTISEILEKGHGGIGPIWTGMGTVERELLEAWLKGERCDASLRNVLDFRFFLKNIQPLLVELGEDGASCAQCHNTHAVFNIRPPNPDGSWTLADARHNYASALKVVNPDDPMNSLILKKPISPREGSDDTGVMHAGGVRWSQRREAPQWKALAEWVQKRLLE